MEIRAQFPIDGSAPKRGRALLDELQGVLDHEVLASAALVVSELVTNCVRHGGHEGYIRVGLQRDGDSLCIRVSSPTGTTTPHLIRSGDRLAGDGGIGLRIVDRLACRWCVNDEESQTSVWVELRPGLDATIGPSRLR